MCDVTRGVVCCFLLVGCLCHLTQNTCFGCLKWVIEGGVFKQLSGALVNDRLLMHPGDQAYLRRSAAPGLAVDWGSFATRAAVRRTCREVTLRCQRVLARYRPGEDKLTHIAVDDPDPGPARGCRACGFEWEEEISTGFVLLWRCTRLQGHHGPLL